MTDNGDGSFSVGAGGMGSPLVVQNSTPVYLARTGSLGPISINTVQWLTVGTNVPTTVLNRVTSGDASRFTVGQGFLAPAAGWYQVGFYCQALIDAGTANALDSNVDGLPGFLSAPFVTWVNGASQTVQNIDISWNGLVYYNGNGAHFDAKVGCWQYTETAITLRLVNVQLSYTFTGRTAL